MSEVSRANLRSGLKAIGLAVIIAAYLGVFAWSVYLHTESRDSEPQGSELAEVVCLSLLPILLVVPLCFRRPRAWLAGLPRARRVSLRLFVLTVLLFGLSWMCVWGARGRFSAGLANGGVHAIWNETTWQDAHVTIGGFWPFHFTWKPLVVHCFWGGEDIASGGELRTFVELPLWMIGVAALWPWWKPWLLWLLGGRVRGHGPLRSWHYRLALVALLSSTFLYWLSHQDLRVWYGRSCWVQLVSGRIFWRHDSLEKDYRWPRSWELRGYWQSRKWPVWTQPHGPSVSQVEMPVWPAPVVCLAWLILAVRPRHRYRRRWENGLCLHCGYDLRGLKERCTECGQSIEPERLAQLAGDGKPPETETPGGVIEAESPRGEEKP